MSIWTKSLHNTNDTGIDGNKPSLKKKILIIFLKIIRWPIMMMSVPAVAVLLMAISNDAAYTGSLAVLVIGSIALGIIGAAMTGTFLAATGIATLTYIVVSFFIKPYGRLAELQQEDQVINFDNTKLFFIVFLIILVFVGDLTAFVIRLIRRNLADRKRFK